jgi:hypothetical protein
MAESRARRRLMVAAIPIACLALLAFAAVVVRANGEDSRQPNERLASLRAAMTPEPPPPEGAQLLSRQESPGDGGSDGPTIEWQYAYSGTAADFAAHYRTVLIPKGWRETVPGNMPGQLTNFERSTGQGRVVIILFAPVTSLPNFEVLALG